MFNAKLVSDVFVLTYFPLLDFSMHGVGILFFLYSALFSLKREEEMENLKN